ncbi:hypothetical protein PV783_24930 [Chitinophaga sp. CC14]|uniref:hypothetical protein n=1 Tax=Chitinophaga sp. CC14 TaxID=3029199 RepID=UPI003B787836
MKAEIRASLLGFLQENYPEIILLFSERGTLTQYLDDRMNFVEPLIDELIQQGDQLQEIIDLSIAELTSSFGPSKFNYLKQVMAEEFPQEYQQFEQVGVLRSELTNMIVACSNAFDAFEFSEENLDDHFMRHMVIAEMQDYLISRSQN